MKARSPAGGAGGGGVVILGPFLAFMILVFLGANLKKKNKTVINSVVVCTGVPL